MTEAEWLASTDPVAMIEALPRAVSDRKLRLFATAIARTTTRFHQSQAASRAIELADRIADEGLLPSAIRRDDIEGVLRELSELRGGCAQIIRAIARTLLTEQADDLWVVWDDVAKLAIHQATGSPYPETPDGKRVLAEECARHCILVRDIFGNPFRPITFDPAWRTTDVMLLATGIYEERAFDRLPILADALQDAGCDSADLLTHLRDPHATHVRGCWALDLVLGKV
jgi:hypothetical protein